MLAATPAGAYRELLYRPGSRWRAGVDDRFEVIARPGKRIGGSLREGDVLLEVTLGRSGPGRCVTLSARDLRGHCQARQTHCPDDWSCGHASD